MPYLRLNRREMEKAEIKIFLTRQICKINKICDACLRSATFPAFTKSRTPSTFRKRVERKMDEMF
jgi:hypothetical protein